MNDFSQVFVLPFSVKSGFYGSSLQNAFNFQTCTLLAHSLPLFAVMNPIDLIIIYLTCGAPFGVYYFYQQKQNFKHLWLNSLLVTLCWVPYAVKLLHSFVTKGFRNNEFDEKSLPDSFEKGFSQILLEENTRVSVFDLRETLERYSGLTRAFSEESVETDADLFQVSNHPNKKLAAKLLNRRNRSRLQTHQILARRDFLRMIEKIYSDVFEKEKVRTLAVDFVKLINDLEALAGLHEIFQKSKQAESENPVNAVESEVWNPIEPKQLPMRRKALNFRTMSAATTTSKPD